MISWRFYAAGAGGGAMAAILDFFRDWNNGTVARVASVLGQHLFGGINLLLSSGFWAIILIVMVSLFVCWIYEVTSRLDGFLRGCSVVAAFSIGAPSPIINQQLSPATNPSALLVPGNAQVAALGGIISAATAQETSQSNAATGQTYVRLVNLRDVSPIPESTVTILTESFERVSLYTVAGNIIKIAQLYGAYFVEVQTPGFATIEFPLKINDPVSAIKVSAPESSVPTVLQRLLTPVRVTAAVDNAETYKQLGRQQRLAGNWDAAIRDYQKSLEFDPSDALTHDYLGYAYFRQARYSDATKEFNAAQKLKPDYKWSLVNLIKVDCAQGNYEEARKSLQILRAQTNIWRSDVEFARICKPILN